MYEREVLDMLVFGCCVDGVKGGGVRGSGLPTFALRREDANVGEESRGAFGIGGVHLIILLVGGTQLMVV